ncbi:MAG: CBS domain-containing protein [Acidobacteriota bacterium]
MVLEELIRQDFEHLRKTTELDVAKESEDAILMQSVEGHAHNGAGMFHKRRFVNITISDIVSALQLDPESVKTYRQTLIDEVFQFVDRTIGGKGPQRLVNDEGQPFLRASRLKNLVVNPASILKGLYLGGLRDDSEIRRDVEKEYNIKIGGGRSHFVDLRIMKHLNLDGETLAHEAHFESVDEYKRVGMIVPAEKCQYQESEFIRYFYIRDRMGPGHSDDTAIVCAGLLFNRDVALGVFLADAIDTLEKYVKHYSDQDNELARLISSQYKELDAGMEDVHRLIYLSTIPEKKVDIVPDSSLRYLLSIDKKTKQTLLDCYLAFIEGKPLMPMAIWKSKITTTEFFSYINHRFLNFQAAEAHIASLPIAARLSRRVSEIMETGIMTVDSSSSVSEAIQKMLAGNRNFLVVTQNGGKIVGVVKASDLLKVFEE